MDYLAPKSEPISDIAGIASSAVKPISDLNEMALAVALNRDHWIDETIDLQSVVGHRVLGEFADAMAQAVARASFAASAAQLGDAILGNFSRTIEEVEQNAFSWVHQSFIDRSLAMMLPSMNCLAGAEDLLLGETIGFTAKGQELASGLLDDARTHQLSILLGTAGHRITEQLHTLSASVDYLNSFGDFLASASSLINPFVNWPDLYSLPPETEPGTFHDDLFLLQDPRIENDAKLAALDRMVDRFHWVGKRPRVQRALGQRVRESEASRRTILRDEVRAAAVLALGTIEQPQVIRFGATWVHDEQGKVTAIVPELLEVHWYVKWFRMTVARSVERSLLEQPDRVPTLENRFLEVPDGDLVPLEDAHLASSNDDPLMLLVERDEHDDARRQLAFCLELATPRQRAILRLLHQGLNKKEAAQRLGISESTLRVHLMRLRDRVRASGLVA